VGKYVRRAKQAGLVWPVAEDPSEEELYQQFFPEDERATITERPVPDWEEMHREL